MIRFCTRVLLPVLGMLFPILGFSAEAGHGIVSVPYGISAKGYPAHAEIRWQSQNGAAYAFYKVEGNGYVKVGTSMRSPFLDFSVGSSSSERTVDYILCPEGMDPALLSDPVFMNANPRASELWFSVNIPAADDGKLLDLVQEYTTRYFSDFAEPYTGLARERSNDVNADIVTTGGSGFGIMALIAAVERGYIGRDAAFAQFGKILSFLDEAERFHGAWAHWYDADTRKPFSFSKFDDGGDLVETAFLAQGLITLRQWLLRQEGSLASSLAAKADSLWKSIEWSWYTKGGSDALYWHWSKNWGWKMNHRIKGYDETLVTYVLAASSPTYPVDAAVYHSCYKDSDYYYNGKEYYGIPLTIGMEYGGPLFFTHYSFLGLDPRGLRDDLTDYFERGRAHSLIHYRYAMDNPRGHAGLGADLWGFTSSDDPLIGYGSHHPGTRDENGTVSPTAPVSAIVYVPEESLRCMRHLYYDLGAKSFGPMGFYDAYNPSMVEGEQVVRSYLAIDQGPIAVMIENYRSGLLWDLFMSAPEISVGLERLGFSYSK